MEKNQGGTKFIGKFFFGKQPEKKAGEDESLGQEMLINAKAGTNYSFSRRAGKSRCRGLASMLTALCHSGGYQSDGTPRRPRSWRNRVVGGK